MKNSTFNNTVSENSFSLKYAFKSLKKNKLLRYSLLAISLKTLLFLFLISSDTATTVNFKTIFFSAPPILAYLSFFMLALAPAFLFTGKVHKWSFSVINLLITILYIGDIWYFRSNRSFLNYHMLQYSSNLDNLGSSIMAMFRWVDLLFLLDLIVIIILTLKSDLKIKSYKTQFICFLIMIFIPSSYLFYAHIKVDKLGKAYPNQYLFRVTWAQNQTMSCLTPIGYHIFDYFEFKEQSKQYVFNNEELDYVNTWFSNKKETLPDNEYKDMFKGKNLIILQVESLENFVIGQSINGKEITPTLNKLLENSLYFNNFHEQTHNGTTSDAELLTNTSLFPVRSGSTFFRFPNNTYKSSLPILMKDMGYNTLAAHPDKGSYWNWMSALKSIGFEKCLDSANFEIDEIIGLGLSDRSYLKQLSTYIKNQPQPFYNFSITLTNHTPFNMPKEFIDIDTSGPLKDTKIGKSIEAVHYTDKQIGMFLNELDTSGILDNSVVVIYGDHEGVHKFFADEIATINDNETWYKNNDLKVPLIIYSKGMEGKTIDTIGGQVDILPTLSYLFGVDSSKYDNSTLGRNLLNTNKSFAVLSTRKIISTGLSEEEQQYMIDSLDLSDKLIRSNYFRKE